MARDQVNIFMSFPVQAEGVREKFVAFDAEVRKKSPLVYQWSGEYSGMLRLLRGTKFRFYKQIVRFSQIRNKSVVEG